MFAFLLACLAAADREAEKMARLREILEERKLKKYIHDALDEYFLQNGIDRYMLRHESPAISELESKIRLLSDRLARLKELADDVSDARRRKRL